MVANPNHFALVVGINRYPGLSDLRFAKNDAADFAGWLVDPVGGGCDPEHVKLIHVTEADEAAFGDWSEALPDWGRVTKALGKLHEEARAARSQDPSFWKDSRLYFFASGHGIAPMDASGAYLTAEATLDQLGYNVDAATYANYYRQGSLFRQVIFLMDCCRQRIPGAAALDPPFTRNDDPAPDRVDIVIGYATAYGDVAREPVGPVEDPDAQRGFFTRALLDGLRNGVGAADGSVDVASLERHMRNHVESATNGSSRRQSTRFVVESDEPVILRAPDPTRAAVPPVAHKVVLRFQQDPPAQVKLLDGSLEQLSAVDVVEGAAVVELSDGIYGVTVAGPPNVFPFSVAGSEVTVDVVL
jgi:uncharacterized caspase-like protein